MKRSFVLLVKPYSGAIDDNNIGYDELAFLVTHWNELKTKIFEEEDDE